MNVQDVIDRLVDSNPSEMHAPSVYDAIALIREQEQEIARLTELDAYNTDIIQRFADKLKQAEAERDAIHEEARHWKDSAEVRLEACRHKDKEIADLRADAERLRELLRDIEPHWTGFTHKMIWTAQMAGVMASIRLRLDAALAALEGDK
jgi:hypothetical protein